MNIPASRIGALALLLAAVIIGFWLGWQANGFLAQDRCLDNGGAWNKENRTCTTDKAF